jgi:hypothetical protein
MSYRGTYYRFTAGDAVWCGTPEGGYKATVVALGTADSIWRSGYFVKSESGQEFWFPEHSVRAYSPLDILAASLRDHTE